ncbi:B3/4 domain-containing protein [Anaerotignum propionicum]|uniref:B3/B4 domain-containing protein n=1 Tax=Anaerotignum propionicum TaxID=28446 RepID=UPI00289A1944|nr:phenylalanine--tRNA ligase beta subunit-related protein [Anaerotignum propionicum]
MKKFIVDEKVFEKLPKYCLGIVVAKGIDNHSFNERIEQMLDKQIREFADAYQSVNIRELPNIKSYRDAFSLLGINPNKYMCSIEALAKRVQKNVQLPHINSIVDIGNAFSLKYHLPIGAHDIDKMESDIEIRFSTAQDYFLGLGKQAVAMPEGELVYISRHTVKTRRWIWRQSEDGKITEETNYVFFPIDGFENLNYEQILKARDELAVFLRQEFDCEVLTGYANSETNVFCY